MNPYEVLGVPENADEETIKKAYRELVKKYHPDKYVNNPLADLASEKLKDINEAYDMLINKKTSSQGGGYQSQGSGGYGGGQGYGNYTASYQSVRMLIQQRRFGEAEQMLNGLAKTAEWHYLMGVIYVNRGWYDKGREFIQTAVNMDPNNMEYRATLNSFSAQGRQYRNVAPGGNASACDCCTSMICADCCCECFGGDLISCC
ncbi:MAG TPA: DnaJ domain-containing protein [Candidatus Avimonoglobus intestinipullorum]|uniref:DnaJ domain-containing protein n=1 Tax=Candidatus Avimonoglobus intestinipullorum TaxID=2840699 RepID=A0A9D1LV40_9FIRM|nr:DnaJ domain-containing protein [Candidatus Avimonoglobus intestinipullorum]